VSTGMKVGWILGGVLVVVVGGVVLYAMLRGPDLPEPKVDPALLRKITIEAGPEAVTGSAPSEAGDAAADYAAAVRLVREHALEIGKAWERREDLLAGGMPGGFHAEHFEAIGAHAAAGGRKREMRYLLAAAPEALQVIYFAHPWLEELTLLEPRVSTSLIDEEVVPTPTLFKALDLLACYYRGGGEPQRAIEAYNTLFLLGWHMMAERSLAGMVHLGLQVQRYALRQLEGLYKEQGASERIEALRGYAAQLRNLEAHYDRKWKELWPRPNTPVRAGDIFYVIEKDEDPAWRVQAILMLGIVRQTHAKETFPAIRAKTNRLIEHYASAGGAVEQRAARWARQYRGASGQGAADKE